MKKLIIFTLFVVVFVMASAFTPLDNAVEEVPELSPLAHDGALIYIYPTDTPVVYASYASSVCGGYRDSVLANYDEDLDGKALLMTIGDVGSTSALYYCIYNASTPDKYIMFMNRSGSLFTAYDM